MFSNAKVGDKVFDYLKQEWGEIVYINSEGNYPIRVNFKQDIGSYTIEGFKDTAYKVPTLLWDEVKPIIPPKKPLPDLDIDTRVLVWNEECDKYKRYFSHFNMAGKMFCFDDGFTSWIEESTTSWSNWELADK